MFKTYVLSNLDNLEMWPQIWPCHVLTFFCQVPFQTYFRHLYWLQEKVMFSEASVSHSVHRGLGGLPTGESASGSLPPGELDRPPGLPQGGLHAVRLVRPSTFHPHRNCQVCLRVVCIQGVYPPALPQGVCIQGCLPHSSDIYWWPLQ